MIQDGPHYMIQDGSHLLTHEGGKTYRVVPGCGVAFRLSKCMSDQDRCHRGPEGHTLVDGDDEGDGWLKVVVQAPLSDQGRSQRVWTDSDFGDNACEMETASDEDEEDTTTPELFCNPPGLTVKNTFIDDSTSDMDMLRSLERRRTLPLAWRPLEAKFLSEEADSDVSTRSVSAHSDSDACTDEPLDTSTEMSESEDSVLIPSSSGCLSDALCSDAPTPLVVPKSRLDWASCVPVECDIESEDSVASSEPLGAATAIKSVGTVPVEPPPPPVPVFPRSPPATASATVSAKRDTKSRGDFKAVLDHLQQSLMTRKDCVVEADVEETVKG